MHTHTRGLKKHDASYIAFGIIFIYMQIIVVPKVYIIKKNCFEQLRKLTICFLNCLKHVSTESVKYFLKKMQKKKLIQNQCSKNNNICEYKMTGDVGLASVELNIQIRFNCTYVCVCR